MKKILFIIIAIIAFVIGWWLISPLFIDREVNEELNYDRTPDTGAQDDAATSTQTFDEAMEEASKNQKTMDEDMPEVQEVSVLSTGNFVDVAHDGEGEVKVIDLKGERIVRFENFDVLNGPDLRVLLSKNTNVESSDDLGEYIELGKLKGNKGNQNYVVPEGVNVEEYGSVVIYCKPFHVVFNSAVLN